MALRLGRWLPLGIWTLILLWCLFPLFWEIPAWAGGAAAVIMVLRWLIGISYLRKFFASPLGKWAFKFMKAALTFFVTYMTWREYHTFLNYTAAITLFAVYATIKFLETSTRRDEQVMIYFLFFLVVGNTIFYQDLYITLHVLIALGLLFERLMYLYAPQGWATRQRLKSLGRSVLLCLPVIALIFLLFPRTMGTRWGVPGTRQLQQTKVGFQEEVRPGNFDQLQENSSLAMRVEFLDGFTPAKSDLYWRGMELAETDGMNWRNSFMMLPLQTQSSWGKDVGRFNTQDLEESDASSSLDQLRRYEVLLEPYGGRTVLALDFSPAVQKISGNITAITRRQGDVWQVMFPIGSRIKYAGQVYLRSTWMPSEGKNLRPAYVAEGPRLAKHERRRYLAVPYLPEGEVLTWFNAMDHASPQAYLNAVLQYFARNLTYAYPGPEGRPKVKTKNYFATMLLHYRQGICSDFASMFALAMRWGGIPARVISGYQGGDYNSYGHYWQVLQNHAHAWTEVFLPEVGWVRVDPTAHILPARIAQGPASISAEGTALAARAWWKVAWDNVTLLMDDLNYRWADFLISFDREGQKDWFWQHGQRLYHPLLAFLLAAGMAALFMLLVLNYYRWVHRQKSRPSAWQKTYQQLEKYLAAHGLPRQPFWGPQRFMAFLQAQRPDIDWPPVIMPYAWAEYAQQKIDGGRWGQQIKAMKKALRRKPKK
ncbi:MAG: DUF3488 domain-containing transglutaminase family protein [Bacteriovoracaceae bacterium]|nr:DUF3488 domain-containing transglutaminase family protein [Bacteriovoracaceae bacterium]